MTALPGLFGALFSGKVWRLAALAAIIYGVGLYSLVLPMLFALAIDVLLPMGLATHLLAVVAAALLLALLRFALAFVQDYEFQRLRIQSEISVLRQVLGNVLARPADAATDRAGTGIDGWLRIWLVNFQYQMTEIVFFCAYALLISVTVMGLVFWLDWRIGAIVLLFAGLHFANFQYHNGRSRRHAEAYGAAKTAFMQDVTAATGAKRAINVARLDGVIGQALSGKAGAVFQAGCQQAEVAAGQGLVQSVLRGGLYLLLVAYSAPQIAAGHMTGGSLLFILLLVSFAYEPVYRLNQITAMANQLAANMAPLRPFLGEPAPAKPHRPAPSGALELTAARVAHGGRPLFPALTASLRPGTLYLLKGPSGSGKTSLLDVLSGLSQPSAGSLRWADAMVQDHRAKIFLAPQRPCWFSASLADNISLFDPLPDEARIAVLLEELGLGGLAQDLHRVRPPESLSLGERQRVGLARALYRNPGLLLLDEPTANLDRRTEQRCLAAIAARSPGRITVLVSHGEQAAAHAGAVIDLGTSDGA